MFAWFFVRDVLQTKLNLSSKILAISSLTSLAISSAGTFIISFIFLTKSNNAFLYRDALFTYLHFQYNGFFTLAIFSLLFNNIDNIVNETTRKSIFRFAFMLSISVIPSWSLSFLWLDHGLLFRVAAMGSSFLLLITLVLFFQTAQSLKSIFGRQTRIIRVLVFLSICSFMLKVFLQIFTIVPEVSQAIFGNRPIIMGFLHLVFLGFVSLFALALLVKRRFLDGSQKFTKIALAVFATGIIVNESLLISQGLITIFTPATSLFNWLLWVAGIWLVFGSVLITIARFQIRKLR